MRCKLTRVAPIFSVLIRIERYVIYEIVKESLKPKTTIVKLILDNTNHTQEKHVVFRVIKSHQNVWNTDSSSINSDDSTNRTFTLWAHLD